MVPCWLMDNSSVQPDRINAVTITMSKVLFLIISSPSKFSGNDKEEIDICQQIRQANRGYLKSSLNSRLPLEMITSLYAVDGCGEMIFTHTELILIWPVPQQSLLALPMLP